MTKHPTGYSSPDIKWALSFKQPMAWALFHGKDVDNRKKYTSIRGKIYIHASLTFDMEYWKWIAENDNRLVTNIPHFVDFRLPDRPVDMFMGGIIGEINIDDCTKNTGSRWYFGEPYYALVVSNPVLYDKLIPYKGWLGFFRIDI